MTIQSKQFWKSLSFPAFFSVSKDFEYDDVTRILVEAKIEETLTIAASQSDLKSERLLKANSSI